MAFPRLYFSKFSQGNVPPDPAMTVAATPLVRQTKAHHPKKFLDPYAYDLACYDKIWQGKFTKHPAPPQQKDGSFAPGSRLPATALLLISSKNTHILAGQVAFCVLYILYTFLVLLCCRADWQDDQKSCPATRPSLDNDTYFPRYAWTGR